MRGPGKPVRLAVHDPRGRGRPVLLVHGIAHGRFVWEGIAARLDPGLRPIAVDLRGHGDSEWSVEGHYDVRDHALDLAAVLDALAIERSAIVGHSLGGSAATLFAAAHPGRVDSLALLDTGPVLSRAGLDQVVGDAGRAPPSFPSVEAYREQLARVHPLADPALLAAMAEQGVVGRLDGRYEVKMDPGVLGGTPPTPEQLERLEAELWEALGRLRCPVLVVRGGRSALLPPEIARRMVDEALADGRLETLERAGHALMLDDEAGLLEALRRFLGSH